MKHQKVKYNKSKTYLLPLLAELIDITEYIKYIKNTYMFINDNYEENNFFIELECDFKDPEYTKYEYILTQNQLYIDSIDIGNKTLFIFKFPDEYLYEYNCLKESKYSKFGEDAKSTILEFWTEIYGTNGLAIDFLLKVKHILNKDERLKNKLEEKLSSKTHQVIIDSNAELGEHVELKKETINIEWNKNTLV